MRSSVLAFVLGALLAAGAASAFFLVRAPALPKEAHEHEKEKEHPKHDLGEIRLSANAVESVGIKTSAVQKQKLGRVLTASAVIRPNADQVAHVSPRVTGKVIEIKAVQGSEVKQGGPLVVLDSVDVGHAAASYLKAKAALEVAKVNFDREGELIKRNATRGIDFYEAKSQHLRSRAELQAARQELFLLGWPVEQIEKLKWDDSEGMSRVTVSAPVEGEVIEKHATLGEVVRPETNLFTISNLSTVWVVLDLYQKDVRRAHKGQPVLATVDAYPGRTFAGKVTYVGKVLVEETRTLEVRVELENKEALLKPGMYVTATVMDDQDEHARECVTVPSAAVQRVDDVPVVFLAKQPGHYERRALTLGQRFGDWHEVLVGLEGGEQIVTEGSFTLKSELLRSRLAEDHDH